VCCALSLILLGVASALRHVSAVSARSLNIRYIASVSVLLFSLIAVETASLLCRSSMYECAAMTFNIFSFVICPYLVICYNLSQKYRFYITIRFCSVWGCGYGL